MTLFHVDRGLKHAYEKSLIKPRWELVGNQPKAIETVKRTLLGEITISAVQGPPGTGKTSILENFAEECLDEIVTSKERNLYVYIAPTNYLTYSAFIRITSILLRKGFTLRDVISTIRIYGSKITTDQSLPSLNFAEKQRLTIEELKQLNGDIPTDSVRLVFTTEFQRITGRFAGSPPKAIRLVVDEASKTPYFRALLPLADKLARESETYYPQSMAILGDPEQAIVVPEEYKERNIPLLMRYVERVLKRRNLFEERWIMLNRTFRLPSPSERPISHGYYNGKLIAYYNSEQRLKLIEEIIIDNSRKARRILQDLGIDVRSSKVQALLDAIDEAYTSRIPILTIETRRFRGGDTYEQERSELAFISSAYLQALSKLSSGYQPSMVITAPYSDLVNNVSYRFNMRGLTPRIGKPQCVTVQSMIGGEADIIVTMLGKEWSVQDAGYTAYRWSEPETIYPREPELLNVQLSRHKMGMIVIGSIENMKYLHDNRRRIRTTFREILNLTEEGKVVKLSLH